MKKVLRSFFAIKLSILLTVSCSLTTSHGKYHFKKASQDGHYVVTLKSNNHPPPMKRIHSWTVTILNRQNKATDAQIDVYGGMPSHRHDFPTSPRITKNLGNGQYLVDGIKFTMPGHWQIRFTIIEENKRDFVAFDIQL